MDIRRIMIFWDILAFTSEHAKPIDEAMPPNKNNSSHMILEAMITPIIETPGNISFDMSISVFSKRFNDMPVSINIASANINESKVKHKRIIDNTFLFMKLTPRQNPIHITNERIASHRLISLFLFLNTTIFRKECQQVRYISTSNALFFIENN